MKKLIARKLIATAMMFTSLAFIAPAHAASADQYQYTLDPVHTQIMFNIDHLGFSQSHGRFTKFSGGFHFDEDAPEKSSVNVTIDTNSIFMNSSEWENHLKNADFFNVTAFPQMTFKSTSVAKTSDRTATVTGDLTLLGVTKPVVLDVIFNKAGIHPYNKNYISGFSVKGSLKRSDFGMNFGLPGIGDDVNLDIEVEGVRQDDVPAKKG